MHPVLFAIHTSHVLAGIIWLGGAVFMNIAVLPAILALPGPQQRDMGRRVVFGPERLMVGAALLAGVFGIVRGTVFGPIQSIEALATTYGIVWVTAIAITVAVFFVGARITGPTAHALLDDDRLWVTTPTGEAPDARGELLNRLRLSFRLELIGILLVFALMPILRFL
jgi:uncharacterized membrane protein